jgi:tRNA dimethylallyltransferase
MQGISAIPAIASEVRDQANADWEAMGADAFRTRLAKHDAEIVERLKPGDRQRHVRAWEVVQATGRPLTDWQKRQGEPAPWQFKTVLLAPDRAWLRQRIETRFDVMLEQGVLAEVRSVFDRQPDPKSPGLKAHGAPELFRHFRGGLSLHEARQITIDHTRQYAKRQMTWFRHQLTPDVVANPATEKFLDKIEV